MEEVHITGSSGEVRRRPLGPSDELGLFVDTRRYASCAEASNASSPPYAALPARAFASGSLQSGSDLTLQQLLLSEEDIEAQCGHTLAAACSPLRTSPKTEGDLRRRRPSMSSDVSNATCELDPAGPSTVTAVLISVFGEKLTQEQHQLLALWTAQVSNDTSRGPQVASNPLKFPFRWRRHFAVWPRKKSLTTDSKR